MARELCIQRPALSTLLSLLLSSPFLQVISFWIMFYLGSCFDFFFFLIMHLLDEEVMVGSGPGRGCRWPWSWDSILTQGTGLFTVPFFKKNPTPFPSIPPWLEEALGANSPCLPREVAQCPLAYFFPLPMFLLGSLITGGVKNDL